MRREAQAGFREFPLTRWSLVDHAASISREAGFQALTELLDRYLPALRAHLVTMRGMRPDRADDILQGFVAAKVLQGDLLARADRKRGRFRTYLLTCLERYLVGVVRRETARKRSPGQGMIENLEDHAETLAVPGPSAEVFDTAWAREVIAETLRRLRSSCERDGKEVHWQVFEARVVLPILEDATPVPYEELVERFGFKSPIQASNVLLSAKRMFARTLKAVIGEYVSGEDEVEAEIEELHAILAGRA
jgi:RNA polymerase sigma-70 factor (ECF subfamily)